MNSCTSLVYWLLRRLGVVAVVAVLAACTTAPISSQQTLTGQEGAVVVKLITNGSAEIDPAESLTVLNLERVLTPGEKPTGRDRAILVRTRVATHTTAVFSGMVNPGRYVVKNAMGLRGNMHYTFPIDAKFGTFEVVNGEVTLLGTLLIQPQFGNRFVVAYVPPDAELQKTFETLYPALASQTQGRKVRGFDPTPDLERRAALAPESKRRASLWNGLTQTSDGEFMAGSKLGKVLWRPAGQIGWRELDAGTWREVLSARPYRGGILAAGEEGLLRLTMDEGRSWRSLIPPDDALIQVAQPMPDGSVIAFARRDRVWSAYRTEDLDAGAWHKLGEFADTASINLPWMRPTAVSMRASVGLMLPNGDLHVADGKTLVRLGSGQSTLDVTPLPDGSLVSQTAVVAKTTMLSRDAGRTWVDLNTSRFVVAIAFKDTQTAYAVAPISPGVFPGPFGLMTTRDRGRKWEHTGMSPGLTGPYAVRQLMVDRSDGSLLAFLPDNAIVRSTDEGKSWKFVKDN